MKNESLEEQLFGGDDYENLSDLEFELEKNQESNESSEYESDSEKKKQPKKVNKSLAKKQTKKIEKKAPKRRVSRKRKSLSEDNVLDDGEIKSDDEPEIPFADLPPALKEFEETVESMKSRKKKRDYDMVEVDDMISKLAEEMKEATSKDLEANQNNKPALAKIKLLPRVISVLEKTYLHEQLIDNEILEPIRMLEPMDDESLPTLSIRRPLLELLRKMPIAPEDIRPLS